jgi:hypothetical protein
MTIHETIVHAREDAGCVCGAEPGQPCDCGPRGVHLARIARARHFHGDDISAEDFAAVIADADVFTGTTVVLDPESGAA